MRRGFLALLVFAALSVPFAGARSLPDNDPIGDLRTNLGYAISDERDALKALDEVPPGWAAVRGDLRRSRDLLDGVRFDVDHAVRRGELSAQEGAAVKKASGSADSLDLDALAAVRRKDAQRAKQLIERAIPFKRQARLLVLESQSADDGGAGRECTATKVFELYAIPDGYGESYADVFPHVPTGAKNIKVSFVDVKSGRAAPAQPFPGQTWKFEIKGRKADGRLWVRVTLSGTGIGQPDEKHVTWKVVVGYDVAGACPK